MTNETIYRMPAEWEMHAATWIAWPHEESDWPGKLEVIHWVYAEIVRVLTESEPVEVICKDHATKDIAKRCLDFHKVREGSYRLHLQENDRSWLRDSMPTAVKDEKNIVRWINWNFRAWAKYDNYKKDVNVPSFAAKVSGLELVKAMRPDNQQPLTLEGGAIDVDGLGTLLTTEECLLSAIQERNPGLSREGYEKAFLQYLGVRKTIWLGHGCAGDDTHGHVDDIARFVGPAKVVLAYEHDPALDNHKASADNLERLKIAKDARGQSLEVICLPMPRDIYFGHERLPASYANFYIANKVVIVPTFNDSQDVIALNILQKLFPTRHVIGIHAVDLVLGQGTLHCLTQQQPV